MGVAGTTLRRPLRVLSARGLVADASTEAGARNCYRFLPPSEDWFAPPAEFGGSAIHASEGEGEAVADSRFDDLDDDLGDAA